MSTDKNIKIIAVNTINISYREFKTWGLNKIYKYESKKIFIKAIPFKKPHVIISPLLSIAAKE